MNSFLRYLNSLYYPKGKCPFPEVVMIEPTNSCTLKCIMCDVQKNRKSPNYFLTLEQFESIIGQLPRVRELLFCGIGEPLLNRQVFDMVKSGRARGIPFINFVTNGELLDADIFKRLSDCGIDQLQVSVPAATEEAFSKIRDNPKISLQGLKDKLRAVMLVRDKHVRRPKVIINAVINNHNADELGQILDLCSEVKADGACFIQLTTMLGKNEPLNISRSGVSRIFKSIKKSGRDKGLEVMFLTGNDYGRCYQMWDYIMIHSDGSVSPCNGIMPTENLGLGNVFHSRVADIWNSEKYCSLRNKVRNSSLEHCRFCESGYLIEGITPGWVKNYYLRPVKNFLLRIIKNAFKRKVRVGQLMEMRK